MTSKKKWILFGAVALGSFLADFFTKLWAKGLPTFTAANGQEYGKPVTVIENYWDWQLSFNDGAAFSFLSGNRALLTIIGVAAMGFVLYQVHKTRPMQKLQLWGWGLVFGGAIGNVYDRVLLGHVIDFIRWHWHEKAWPTFNIADVVLVIGAALLIIDQIKNGNSDDEVDEEA